MVGERLAEIREQKALTLHDLEELSGVGADGISKIENGHRKPRPSTLRKLARALGVEVEDFFREPALAGKAEAPREAGQPDEETPPRLVDAEVLENIAELWDALLSRGLYDRDTLGQMYWAGGLLGMSHEANIQKYREDLPPSLLKQLEAAEERFLTVDGQILELLEKSERGDAVPPDELAAKREARRQELRGGGHARRA
jgi:transcriptional regulator with XRE-family HTH domain